MACSYCNGLRYVCTVLEGTQWPTACPECNAAEKGRYHWDLPKDLKRRLVVTHSE